MESKNASKNLGKSYIKETIKWWEAKRITYNFVLLIYLINAVCIESYILDYTPSLVLNVSFIALKGLLFANIIYTFGWAIEILILKDLLGYNLNWKNLLFKYGLIFSVLLIVITEFYILT